MGERKFKVGDRVVIKNSDARGIIRYIDNEELGFNYAVELCEKTECGITLKSRGLNIKSGLWLAEWQFELDDKFNECIVIYRKENQVIAHNKATGEKAIAKCSPEDTFDFNIGAKLAFERLMTTRRIVKLDKYEIGDKVKIVDAWTNETYENADGRMDKWLGKVMTIRDIDNGDYRMEEDIHEWYDGWYWNEHSIEGKVVEDTTPTIPTVVQEVKRHAKVGEYIKVVNATHDMGDYENGDILKVTQYYGSEKYGSVHTINLRTNSYTIYLNPAEYVVLEGYVPTEDIKVEEPKKEEPPFKVGDTVEMLVDLCGVPKGVRGTVVKVTYDLVVDFHVAYSGTHKANDLLPNKTGLYVLFEHVKKVN